MNRLGFLALTLLACAGCDHAGAQERLGTAQLYPDPALTPGLAATTDRAELIARYTDHCPGKKPSCTYSEAHRDVSDQVHRQVYDEYRVPPGARNIGNGEVDHFWPLCAGGSNDIQNLWYQPRINRWNGRNYGFHEKDDLETWLCAQIRTDPDFDVAWAYKRLTTDWVAYYLSVVPPHHDTGE